MAAFFTRYPSVLDLMEEEFDSFEPFGDHFHPRSRFPNLQRLHRMALPYSRPRYSQGANVRGRRNTDLIPSNKSRSFLGRIFEELNDLDHSYRREEETCGRCGNEIQEKKARPEKELSIWTPDNGSEHFEVNFNLVDCDPDKIKVEFKDGLLKVEGKRESPDGSFTFVSHERTLPEGVSASSLKASLLPDGRLRINQEQKGTKVLSVTTQQEKTPEKSLEVKESKGSSQEKSNRAKNKKDTQ